MTNLAAIELVERARAAGLEFETTADGVRIRGPKAARMALKAELAPAAEAIAELLAPHPAAATITHPPSAPAAMAPMVKAIASPRACTLGQGSTTPCPACRYIHGDLGVRDPCADCRSVAWTVSLIGADGRRRCSECLRGKRPLGNPAAAQSGVV